MKPTRPHQHKVLPTGENIRILLLEPAQRFTDKVYCTLQQTSLDHSTQPQIPFEALSYVWGSPKGDQAIICDGHTMHVTKNCLDALQHLRWKWTKRTLWVDAICIDQSSTDERNHQVKLMGKVYGSAERVLVWLGLGNHISSGLFRDIWKNERGEDLEWWFVQNKRAIPKIVRGPFKKAIDVGCKILKDEFDSEQLKQGIPVDWFTRVWTLQEFVLGSHVTIVCGRTTLSWSDFEKKMNEYSHDLAAPIARTLTVKPNLRRSQYTYSTGIILSTMAAISTRSASDPRDKVFGIYSICATHGLVLPDPDYTKPVSKVFEEYISCVIAHTRSLQVLSHIPVKLNNPGWPSWVPDLEVTINDNPWITFPHISFRDAFQFVVSPGKLFLEGLQHAYLVEIGQSCPVYDEALPFFEAEVVKWLLHCYRLEVTEGISDFFSPMYARRSSYLPIKLHTFLHYLDMEYPAGLDTTNLGMTNNHFNYQIDMHLGPVLKSALLPYIGKLWQGRPAVISSLGHFGIASAGCEIGDIIAFFHGSPLPMVVRTQGPNFRLIGTVCLKGLPATLFPLQPDQDYGVEVMTLI